MTAEGTERTGEIRGVNMHWVGHQSLASDEALECPSPEFEA